MFFWELFEVLPWFEGTIFQEKKEELLRFSFQFILDVFLDIAGPKMF